MNKEISGKPVKLWILFLLILYNMNTGFQTSQLRDFTIKLLITIKYDTYGIYIYHIWYTYIIYIYNICFII